MLDRPDDVRRAVEPDPLRLEPAAELVVLGELPVAVVGDVEVEVAVVVVVEERPARRPVGPVDPGRLADVAERAVAVVQEEDVRAVVAEEDVGVAVVVDVADDDPVAEPREAEARLTRSRPGTGCRPGSCRAGSGPSWAVPRGRSVAVAK